MDVLDIHDAAAGPWLSRRLPKRHLLMGDSVARDSGMHSRVLADAGPRPDLGRSHLDVTG